MTEECNIGGILIGRVADSLGVGGGPFGRLSGDDAGLDGLGHWKGMTFSSAPAGMRIVCSHFIVEQSCW